MSKFCDICGSIVEDDNVERCPICFANKWSKNEVESELKQISTEKEFLEAMIDLKKKDPIEYQLKLNQFKAQVKQQEQVEKSRVEEKDVIRCPKCNSTAITTGARGVNNFWGLLGASKTVNRCGNCGYTWKPNGR